MDKAMSRVLFTSPGRLGDTFMSLPVGFQFSRQYGCTVDYCIPTSMHKIVPFIEREDWIGCVRLGEEQLSHRDSDQIAWFQDEVAPKEMQKEYDAVYFLSYKACPGEALTLAVCHDGNVPIDTTNLLREPCLNYPIADAKDIDTLALHLASSEDWRVQEATMDILEILPKLMDKFANIRYICVPGEEKFYDQLPNNEQCQLFYDGGDFSKTAELLAKSVYTGGLSSISALAHAIKSRAVVIIPQKVAKSNPFWMMQICANKGPAQIASFAGNSMFVYSQCIMLKQCNYK